ncbi:MAG: hypothetical protein JSW65_05015 [Candidatus Bipolaricaulota bacterium]|nr:MAG: hypothetical protein JSW65_05015 [Candidatus Bipolaricaulota bacterium]
MMLVAALPVLHLLSAALCTVAGRAVRWVAAGTWLAGASVVAAIDVAVIQSGAIRVSVGGWAGRWGIELVADEASVALLSLLVLLHGCVLLHESAARRRGSFYALLQVGVAAASAVTVSNDLFNLFVLLDLLTLVSYLLVGYERRPQQLWASLKYLLLASLGMGLFLVGGAVVYEHTGSMNLGVLREAVAAAPDAPWIGLAGALLLAGAGVKAGIFVLSLWLPAAHAVAPPAISALLSGVVVKMGSLCVLRLASVFPLATALTVLGLVTGILGALYALFEKDLKRMLAFHTLSQIGYALLAFGVGSPAAALAGVAYLVAHGVFKALLFIGAGIAADAAGSSRIDVLRVRRERIPLAAGVALLVGTVSIVGLPPIAGFWAKGLITATGGSTFLHAALALLAVGTAASFAKLLPLLRLGPPGRVAAGRRAAVGVLSLGAVLFGLTLPFWPGSESLRVGKLLADAARSFGLAAAGGLSFFLLRRRSIRLPRGAFFLEEAVLSVLLAFLVIVALLGASR